MRSRFVTCLTAAVVVAIIGGGFPGASIAGNAGAPASKGNPCAGYHPVLDPKDFVGVVDNPYFPLPVGRTLVYRGVKDGQSQIDRVKVSRRTRVVAGITATIVFDVATHRGKLLERTWDWYAQDKQGNVWYLGENTTAYLPNGHQDRSGSWETGVKGAKPGIIMEAHPAIPDAYRQECRPGKAEDTAWIVNTEGSVTVPYGTLQHVLTSLEATRVEPGAFDKKVYAPGIGIVLERALSGSPEVARLVSVQG
jgi:hypothetical protein